MARGLPMPRGAQTAGLDRVPFLLMLTSRRRGCSHRNKDGHVGLRQAAP